MLAHSFLIESSSKLLVTRTGIKARTSSILGLWFPWPIYMFFEMRFDLGTLDSGERSLPFGLLVPSYLEQAMMEFHQTLQTHWYGFSLVSDRLEWQVSSKKKLEHLIRSIIIIIIISILEPCFPLPRVGLFDKSFSKASSPLRTVLRVSRIHT